MENPEIAELLHASETVWPVWLQHGADPKVAFTVHFLFGCAGESVSVECARALAAAGFSACVTRSDDGRYHIDAYERTLWTLERVLGRTRDAYLVSRPFDVTGPTAVIDIIRGRAA